MPWHTESLSSPRLEKPAPMMEPVMGYSLSGAREMSEDPLPRPSMRPPPEAFVHALPVRPQRVDGFDQRARAQKPQGAANEGAFAGCEERPPRSSRAFRHGAGNMGPAL